MARQALRFAASPAPRTGEDDQREERGHLGFPRYRPGEPGWLDHRFQRHDNRLGTWVDGHRHRESDYLERFRGADRRFGNDHRRKQLEGQGDRFADQRIPGGAG